MARLKIDGLEELQKQLKENATMEDVKKTIHDHGAMLQRKMQTKADFKEGYQTGQTKRSIMIEISDGGLKATVGSDPTFAETYPNTEYAPYVEYGTRFMDAQPFVKPAYEEQAEKFERAMRRLVR